MKRTLMVLLSTAGLALASANAEAQIDYGIGAGVSTPFGNFGKIAERGYQLTGLVNFMPPLSEFGVRGDVSFSQFNYRNPLGPTNGRAQIVSATVGAMHASPGLIGLSTIYGIGMYSASSVCGGCSLRSTKVGLNAGAQYEIPMRGVNALLEMRYHFIPGAMSPTTGGVKSSTSFFPLSIVLKF